MARTWRPFCTKGPGGVSDRPEVPKPWVKVWIGKGQGWGGASGEVGPGPPDMGRGTPKVLQKETQVGLRGKHSF